MNLIDKLFDSMDLWRHFPNYQLERRADIFFSLYLTQALEAKLGFPLRSELVPEFPVRIGTIYPKIDINKSFKIDYLSLSPAGDKAVFVELKTEGRSRRPKQDDYLTEARDVGLFRLLEGLLEIFKATNAKKKYFCLLESLANLGLLQIPTIMIEAIKSDNLQYIEKLSNEIKITCQVTVRPYIIYLQPQGSGQDTISFDEFKIIVDRYDDPLSKRFAKSLSEWQLVIAGNKSSE